MFDQSFSFWMNRTQNTSIMSAVKHISALLVVASALLSSCSLLVLSPTPYYADDETSYYEERPHRFGKVYNGLFQVPAEGGIYEFQCANDRFYISKIHDTSMSDRHQRADRRYSPSINDYKTVNDLTYDGPFYTITCNKEKHNWVIKVDPLTATSDDSSERTVWVYMWDGSDNYNFVFRFEQKRGQIP